MTYDFFADEWYGKCGACKTELYAPNKYAYWKQWEMHTHSQECLGGW
jgi:hypothetical protein